VMMSSDGSRPVEVGALRLSTDAAGVREAARLLASGRLVAFPTETVYGLGADAASPAAVRAIYRAKGRPSENPLIAHVADLRQAHALAVFDEVADRLAAAFWPGPLTMVLRQTGNHLADEMTAGLDTVAVRVPSHPVARRLMAAFGRAVAAPSANLSGRLSPTRADHVIADLGGRAAAVLDGGACRVGVESTIVGLQGEEPVLLRSGAVSREALEACLGRPLAGGRADPNRPVAPGAFASHYAPSASLRIEAAAPAAGEAWLGFGPDSPGVERAVAQRNLSPNGDVAEAARCLFDALRQLDAEVGEDGCIAVAHIPSTGLGAAVNDRLRRAAAPRGRRTGAA